MRNRTKLTLLRFILSTLLFLLPGIFLSQHASARVLITNSFPKGMIEKLLIPACAGAIVSILLYHALKRWKARTSEYRDLFIYLAALPATIAYYCLIAAAWRVKIYYGCAVCIVTAFGWAYLRYTKLQAYVQAIIMPLAAFSASIATYLLFTAPEDLSKRKFYYMSSYKAFSPLRASYLPYFNAFWYLIAFLSCLSLFTLMRGKFSRHIIHYALSLAVSLLGASLLEIHYHTQFYGEFRLVIYTVLVSIIAAYFCVKIVRIIPRPQLGLFYIPVMALPVAYKMLLPFNSSSIGDVVMYPCIFILLTLMTVLAVRNNVLRPIPASAIPATAGLIFLLSAWTIYNIMSVPLPATARLLGDVLIPATLFIIPYSMDNLAKIIATPLMPELIAPLVLLLAFGLVYSVLPYWQVLHLPMKGF